MERAEWKAAHASRYMHLYRGRIALCGSAADPAEEWENRAARKCPDCVKLEPRARLREREAAACAA